MTVVPFPAAYRAQALAALPPLSPDQSVAGLMESELFMVWAVRQWVVAIHQDEPPVARLEEGFRLAGLIDDLPAFHAAISFVSLHAATQLDVRCPQCKGLGAGERLLMELARGALHGDPRALSLALAIVIDPRAVPAAHEALTWWAAVMERAGYALPRRAGGVTVPAPVTWLN